MTPSMMTTQGGEFLSAEPHAIFTPEQFTGDAALMVRTAEQFCRNEVLPLQDRLDAQEPGLMPALIRKAGALGFCGADTPEAYGGLGLPKNLAARMLEMLSLNASFSVTVGITSGISQVGLNLFGTEAQRKQYLPALTSGEQIGAYALSEPNSGSDALSLSTRADERCGRFVLNGTKMWISNAQWADQFLVIAKIGGEQVSAFLVERGFPGVSISREEHKMGLKGSSTARLVLEEAHVPLENLLHEPGKGHQVAFNSLNIGRFKLASMSIGPAREAIRLAATYAQDRRQFGRSISDFGLIRKKLVDMAAWFYAAEAVTYRTGAEIDAAFRQLDGTPEGNRLAAEEFAIECSAAKVLATELESLIVDEALQCYGGYGFTEEFPIARIYRDARVSRIYEGTNEINRVFIADRLARRAAAGKIPLGEGGEGWISELTHQAFAKVRAEAPLDALAKSVDQMILGALSDLVLLAYAEQSARLRATQTGGLNAELHAHFAGWARAQAARAFQIATGEGIALPALDRSDRDAIADAVLAGRLPHLTA